MNPNNFPLISRLCCDIPLVAEGTLIALTQEFSEPTMAEHPVFKKMRESLAPKAEISGGIAALSISGLLADRPHPFEQVYFDMEDTAAVTREFDSISRNDEVQGILLDFNSPGGFMTGGPELADRIKATRKKKPVVAYTSGMMASLAYWIGSQADAVVASRASIVGSIGAYMTFYDWTGFLASKGIKTEVFKNKEGKFKAIGLPGTSLTDEQRDHLQSRIQSGFDEFKRDVLSARPNVPDDAMQGQTFSGREAKRIGLVDATGARHVAMSHLKSLIQ
jgi:signal peptide peptidase SppA